MNRHSKLFHRTRIISAALLAVFLLALIFSGCARADADVELSQMALREANYPVFPEEPQWTEKMSWEAYDKAYTQYRETMQEIQGDPLDEETLSVLTDFAARSTALATAGHAGENVIYSPVSLWAALAMEAQCAAGESQAQALAALGVDDAAALREQVSRVWRRLYTDDGVNALVLANSIWLNSAAAGSYVQETTDILAEDYFASVYAVPMGERAADEAITAWIALQTRGLIGDGAPVVETEKDTLALLASSLYYKAPWITEFDAAQSKKDVFTNADGSETQTDFMYKTQNGRQFILGDGWQAAALPLHKGTMTFILPDPGVAPETLLADPSFFAQIDGWNENSHYGKIHWSVPKFDVDAQLDLLDTLTALGVTDLLNPDLADLSPLTDIPAYLAKATQLSRVKIDEEGVEAAAVTIMENAATGMPPQAGEVCIMDLDRPFLFVIEAEDVPLFVGVVNRL